MNKILYLLIISFCLFSCDEDDEDDRFKMDISGALIKSVWNFHEDSS